MSRVVDGIRRIRPVEVTVSPVSEPVTIPPWKELIKLTSDEVRALSVQVGVPYGSRMQVLRVINAGR